MPPFFKLDDIVRIIITESSIDQVYEFIGTIICVRDYGNLKDNPHYYYKIKIDTAHTVHRYSKITFNIKTDTYEDGSGSNYVQLSLKEQNSDEKMVKAAN